MIAVPIMKNSVCAVQPMLASVCLALAPSVVVSRRGKNEGVLRGECTERAPS